MQAGDSPSNDVGFGRAAGVSTAPYISRKSPVNLPYISPSCFAPPA